MPHGIAYDGKFFAGRLKTRQSKAPIPVPEQVRPVIETWRSICNDTSPEALMFPTFGRGKRKGHAVPRWGKNFPPVENHPDRQETRHPRSPRHFSGNAAYAGNRHAGTRNAKGHPEYVAAREYPDDRGRVRTVDRQARPPGGQFAHRRSARGLDGASWNVGPERTESSQSAGSESNSAKFGEA